MAKTGNREACKILAKQLVQLRKQKNRTYAVSSKVTSMSTQTKVMNSQMKMAGAMSTTAKVRPLILPMDLHDSWFSYSTAQHKTLQHSQLSPYPHPPMTALYYSHVARCVPGKCWKNRIPYVAKHFKRILKQGLIIMLLGSSLVLILTQFCSFCSTFIKISYLAFSVF